MKLLLKKEKENAVIVAESQLEISSHFFMFFVLFVSLAKHSIFTTSVMCSFC